MTKRILAVTGIRSEYDLMTPVFRAIHEHPDLTLRIVATGAHLSHTYGHTVDGIRADGFDVVDTVESLIERDDEAARVEGAGVQLAGLSKVVARRKPDILLVCGDREESIVTAIVGSYLNIPVAHVSGGDRVVGNVDDHIRHAVTKLAHIHFPTNEESAERIRRLGEQPFRIHMTGNPGLDRLASAERMERDELMRWYGFDRDAWSKPLLLVIQHAISSEVDQAYDQMKVTMEAVNELGFNTVISYPNSDTGSADIIRCIEEYAGRPFVRAFENIPRLQFINTMRHASCLLGNSSCGLLEAPFMKLATVNVGNRQKARLHADNVEFVPHERAAVVEAVRRACFDEERRAVVESCASPYGDGNAAGRIARVLAETELNEELFIKDITY